MLVQCAPMKTILTALMSLYATASMAGECLTFTDGERIYDFEFHDNANYSLSRVLLFAFLAEKSLYCPFHK
jgi:hypothetical protein